MVDPLAVAVGCGHATSHNLGPAETECDEFQVSLHIKESRHTIVCRTTQEAGAPHYGYIDRKKENVIFTLLYLGDPLSDWNHICYRVARQSGESTYQT